MRRSLLLLLLGGLAVWNGLRAWEAVQMLLRELVLPHAWLAYAALSSIVWAWVFLGCALGIAQRTRSAARVTITAISVHQVFALAEQWLGTRAPEAQTRLGFAALTSAVLVLSTILLLVPFSRPTPSSSSNTSANERPKL